MENLNETVLSYVETGSIKLIDIEGQGKDCSNGNIASILKKHGYNTGFVGKWHLSGSKRDSGENEVGGSALAKYAKVQAKIKSCGFHFADGIYEGNLPRDEDSFYSHNHEWVTSNAIEFITSTENDDKPFFL